MSQKCYYDSMNKKIKKCKYCNEYYPEEYFGVALTTKDKVYRRQKCRNCYRETKKDLQYKYRTWIDEYKTEKKCCECGINDYRVLEFHHKNGSEKEFSIGEISTKGYGLKKIERELQKCLVICANCHRILHYKIKNNPSIKK
jgi:hypothetical protein